MDKIHDLGVFSRLICRAKFSRLISTLSTTVCCLQFAHNQGKKSAPTIKMTKDVRLEVIVEKLLAAFSNLDEQAVSSFLHDPSIHTHIQAFLDGKEPHKLMFSSSKDPDGTYSLHLEISDKRLKITDQALYIIRKKAEPLPQKDGHLAVISGILDQHSLDTFQTVLQEIGRASCRERVL